MRIYVIYNKLNGKLYVGATRQSVAQRFDAHIKQAKFSKIKYPVHHALNKYGIDNFVIKEVDSVLIEGQNFYEAEAKLAYKEKIWIKELKQLQYKLYNLTDGGDGFCRIFKSFYDAKGFLAPLNLRSQKEFQNYCISGDCPDDIPHLPNREYQEWKGFADFLGYGGEWTRHRNKKVKKTSYQESKLEMIKFCKLHAIDSSYKLYEYITKYPNSLPIGCTRDGQSVYKDEYEGDAIYFG